MAITAGQKYRLNHMNKIAGDMQLGTLLETIESTANSALAEGSVWVGDNTGTAAAIDLKADGQIAVGNGTTITSVAVSGDATLANTGVLTIGAKKVTAAKMALADGKVLVGAVGGAAAEQTLSGDITVTNAGVTAIGAGKVLETMLAVPVTAGLNAKRIAKAIFDVGAGKAIGAHVLGVTLPAKAIITRAFYYTVTQIAGGAGATVALHAEAANDLLTAADIQAELAGSIHECKPDGTCAKMVACTVARELTATVAVDALTAGKLDIFVEYVVTE